MLIVSLYLTFIVFIVFFLGGVMRFYVGLSLWKLFRYSREEMFILLGTTSSESVLPGSWPSSTGSAWTRA